MKRTLVAVALAVVMVVALAAPAFAQMTHSAAYEFDGTIDFKKQAGHWCNTGAEVLQTIVGNGVMDKTQTVSMVPGRITMEDDNNWVAGATPLTVTTVWHLCAPPKFEYDSDAYEVPIIPTIGDLYGGTGFNNATVWDNAAAKGYDALTDQIWAVQVQADPGFSGNLYQDGVAAHGPYGGEETVSPAAYAESDSWTWRNSDSWKLFNVDKTADGKGARPGVGPNYVGSYFDMDQHARTSQGTLQRYISISSPFNHGYLMEDMSVVGKSDVQETFSMSNLPAGADMPGLWWDIWDLF